MHISEFKPSKAAAQSRTAASRHNQTNLPTDIVLAKTIVELSERCNYRPIQNLVRSGFTVERAGEIFIAYLYSVSTRIRPRWVGAGRAAKLIGVSHSQLLEMVKTGELSTLKTRNGYRFFESDLLGWLAARPVSPFSEAEVPVSIKVGSESSREAEPVHFKKDPGRRRRPKRNA
jgi:excisionase family DNA binding protein